jgi:hypothetical protein
LKKKKFLKNIYCFELSEIFALTEPVGILFDRENSKDKNQRSCFQGYQGVFVNKKLRFSSNNISKSYSEPEEKEHS